MTATLRHIILIALLLLTIPLNVAPLSLSLPSSVKDSVTSCRGAVQDVLKSRNSRITVDFPPFTDYQLTTSSKKKPSSTSSSNTPDLYALHSSNQALAQLFVEMFQPLGPKSITVCFNTLDLAEIATKEWDKNVANIVHLNQGQSIPGKPKTKSKSSSPGKAKG